MAEQKTKATDADVDRFLEAVEHPTRQADAKRLRVLFEEVTGEPATMWGKSMVGFGRYAYTYDSGHSGESFLAGFSPRKSKLVLYILGDYDGVDALLQRLGKHKRGKGCLYVNKLADVDEDVLREIATRSVAHVKASWPQ